MVILTSGVENMGKLTGAEVEQRVADGRLMINPFDRKNLNPNSYNLSIGPELLAYKPRHWWTPWRRPLVWGQRNQPDKYIRMKEDRGWVIRPGWFYLGSTVEWTVTPDLVPVLDGRSSGGRLSLHIHATAGFGDVGFEGCWTLELYSIIPVRIFPYIPICQISYETVEGELKYRYQGLYRGARGPVVYQTPEKKHKDQEQPVSHDGQ
jgi:dCTP deaminase